MSKDMREIDLITATPPDLRMCRYIIDDCFGMVCRNCGKPPLNCTCPGKEAVL